MRPANGLLSLIALVTVAHAAPVQQPARFRELSEQMSDSDASARYSIDLSVRVQDDEDDPVFIVRDDGTHKETQIGAEDGVAPLRGKSGSTRAPLYISRLQLVNGDEELIKRADLCGVKLRSGNFQKHCKTASHHYKHDQRTGDVTKLPKLDARRSSNGDCDHILEIQTVKHMISLEPAARDHCKMLEEMRPEHDAARDDFHNIVSGSGNLVYTPARINRAKGMTFNRRVSQDALDRKAPHLLQHVHQYLKAVQPNAVATGKALDTFFKTKNSHFQIHAEHVWEDKKLNIANAYKCAGGESSLGRRSFSCARRPNSKHGSAASAARSANGMQRSKTRHPQHRDGHQRSVKPPPTLSSSSRMTAHGSKGKQRVAGPKNKGSLRREDASRHPPNGSSPHSPSSRKLASHARKPSAATRSAKASARKISSRSRLAQSWS